MIRYFQAKLKTLHEVVVRNRLEQLRKKQRDEALFAQEELLAGVVKTATQSGGDGSLVSLPSNIVEQDLITAADMEPYNRTMSPPPIDITKLIQEERQIDILTVQEDRQNIVSHA